MTPDGRQSEAVPSLYVVFQYQRYLGDRPAMSSAVQAARWELQISSAAAPALRHEQCQKIETKSLLCISDGIRPIQTRSKYRSTSATQLSAKSDRTHTI